VQDDFLRELRPTLAGSREARARLVEELEAHLEDAAACEGEAEALARLGTTAEIAAGWNELQRRRRGRTRRSMAMVSVSLACAIALGVTQYAAGGRPRTPAPKATKHGSRPVGVSSEARRIAHELTRFSHTESPTGFAGSSRSW
jgi:hypothetical protein